MIVYSIFWCRLPTFRIFPHNVIHRISGAVQEIFAGSQNVFIEYFLQVQIIGVILLSVNHYTSLCFPVRHKTVSLKSWVLIKTIVSVMEWKPSCNRLYMSMVYSNVDSWMVVCFTICFVRHWLRPWHVAVWRIQKYLFNNYICFSSLKTSRR
jgi:hypothetical protein